MCRSTIIELWCNKLLRGSCIMLRNVAKNVDLSTLFWAIMPGPCSNILVSDEGSFNVTTLHLFMSQFGSEFNLFVIWTCWSVYQDNGNGPYIKYRHPWCQHEGPCINIILQIRYISKIICFKLRVEVFRCLARE